MSNDKDQGKSIRINTKTYEDIRTLQSEFAVKVGFVPSLTQVVEYLVTKQMKERQS